MFKTLVVALDQGTLAVGMVPVVASLDLKAMAPALGARKATVADASVAQRATGYVPGGISPIGQKRRLPTVLDASATRFDRSYVSAGRRGLEIALAPVNLQMLTNAVVAPIARGEAPRR